MTDTGIYWIRSISHPERIYIGSAYSFRNRKKRHFRLLLKGNHHSPILQHHYDKYGLDDLSFEPLMDCEVKDLLKYEQCLLDFYNPYFNVCDRAGSRLGVKASKETRDKNRLNAMGNQNLLGYTHSDESNRKNSESHKNLPPLTPAQRENLRQGQLKRAPASEETRKKLSDGKLGEKNPMYGKSPTDEQIKLLKLLFTGVGKSDSHKKNISKSKMGSKNPNFGKHPSPETIEKMKASRKLFLEKQKEINPQN